MIFKHVYIKKITYNCYSYLNVGENQVSENVAAGLVGFLLNALDEHFGQAQILADSGPVLVALGPPSLDNGGQHDDNGAILFQHHLPEVVGSRVQRTLGGYVLILELCAVYLHIHVVGVYVVPVRSVLQNNPRRIVYNNTFKTANTLRTCII